MSTRQRKNKIRRCTTIQIQEDLQRLRKFEVGLGRALQSVGALASSLVAKPFSWRGVDRKCYISSNNSYYFFHHEVGLRFCFFFGLFVEEIYQEEQTCTSKYAASSQVECGHIRASGVCYVTWKQFKNQSSEKASSFIYLYLFLRVHVHVHLVFVLFKKKEFSKLRTPLSLGNERRVCKLEHKSRTSKQTAQ